MISNVPSSSPNVYCHWVVKSPELNLPWWLPVVLIAWTVASSLIHVIPVPGRITSSLGTNELFRIWTLVTLVDGVNVGVGVFSIVVAAVVAIVVALWEVMSVVGSMVGAGDAITVGGTVVSSVVTGVVTVGCAGWVHPLITARAITRTNNPMNFFMTHILFSPCL
jgi:hypothetical protein